MVTHLREWAMILLAHVRTHRTAPRLNGSSGGGGDGSGGVEGGEAAVTASKDEEYLIRRPPLGLGETSDGGRYEVEARRHGGEGDEQVSVVRSGTSE